MKMRTMRCGTDDALWDEYFLLLMKHYSELTLPYPFPEALSFIGDPIMRGDALLAFDSEGRAVGALGFIFPGASASEARVCQAESLFILREARGAGTLYRLLQGLSAYLSEQAPLVDTIRFWSPADREDLRKLFGKRCRHVRTNVSDDGSVDRFETNPALIERDIFRWRMRRLSPRGRSD